MKIEMIVNMVISLVGVILQSELDAKARRKVIAHLKKLGRWIASVVTALETNDQPAIAKLTQAK